MKQFRILVTLLFAVILVLAARPAFSARFFPGYGGLKWGSDIHSVIKAFRNGALGKIGGQMVYTQLNPDPTARQRTFGFGTHGLEAVSITFRPAYVQKVGIENIIVPLQKNLGAGRQDRSSAPHLITHVWEDTTSRITLAFSGVNPERTVLLFQQKK